MTEREKIIAELEQERRALDWLIAKLKKLKLTSVIAHTERRS